LRESNTSHDIKGALLTLLNNKPNVTHTINQSQTGQVHTPIFTVELEVNSGKYTIRTTGAARKKKDAEMQAYQRFARLLTDQDKTEVQ
jgi:dsRNA-specific ribonuclease